LAERHPIFILKNWIVIQRILKRIRNFGGWFGTVRFLNIRISSGKEYNKDSRVQAISVFLDVCGGNRENQIYKINQLFRIL